MTAIITRFVTIRGKFSTFVFERPLMVTFVFAVLCVATRMSKLECGYRKLAYEKALRMHPWRKSGSFARETFDALQLQECNEVPPALIHTTQARNELKPGQWSALDVFVDAAVGDDEHGDGTFQKPFGSVEYALNHVRWLRKNKKIAGTTLRLAPGIHFLNGTEMQLGPADSGISISPSGAPGEDYAHIFFSWSCLFEH